MLNDIAAAFDKGDYRTAAQLLKQLQKQSPQDPWVKFYWARLQEVAGKATAADAVYRQLLRQAANPKLVAQARQGLQRLKQTEQQQRQQAIADALADPANTNLGFLILQAVSGTTRQAAIQNFARVMKLDAYTAGALLPARGWRLYRTGSIGELQVYGQELVDAGIPAIWVSQTELEAVQVFRVSFVQVLTPQPTIVCYNEAGQLGSLSFDWSEVRQRVEGKLPIFEQVIDLDHRRRLEWKEQTQDYAHLVDLHLLDRRCILRLHNGTYDFHHGVPMEPKPGTINKIDLTTVHIHWQQLMQVLNRFLAGVTTRSDYTIFANSSADFELSLLRLRAYSPLVRTSETFFDPAYHLYSCASFLKAEQLV
jgi:hypothetical protein